MGEEDEGMIPKVPEEIVSYDAPTAENTGPVEGEPTVFKRTIPARVSIVTNERKYAAKLEIRNYNDKDEVEQAALQAVNLMANTLYAVWLESPRNLEATVTLEIKEDTNS